MKHVPLLMVFGLALHQKSNAQSIKVINATQQDWAGGIAGHTGSNFNFVVECAAFRSEPVPVAIWLGDEVVAIVTKDSLVESNTSITRLDKGSKVRFTIRAGTFHDEYAERDNMLRGEHPNKNKRHPPIAYTGAALLVYTYKGEEKYFVIPKILTHLEPLSYP